MSAVQPFAFDGKDVRVVLDEDGEPRFVATDVARALGHASAKDMTRSLDADEKGGRLVPTPGGEQYLGVITEAGLYAAIFARQTGRIVDPAARETVHRFKRWVTHEVLPALRRTGTYTVPAQAPRELSRLELIDMARDSELRALAAEAATQALLPSATAWDHLAAADGDWSLREAAQILHRDHGVDTGQQRLAASLREIGWCDRTGQPYQRHVDAGRLVRRATTYAHPRTGERIATTQLRVTPKGLGRLRELLAPSGQVVHADEHVLTAVPS